ncbi:glycosyl transferase family 1 [Kouleothrix aurantiaca]|uniref:Glycosyl transferase family 1 n=1 Tax=Kouleothrix aurantiaca TaxID=186479 RepID=A0A0P9DDN4_9CHLR|nr:glycosyl transferase family 1 [Kouleothrix aurantiaca]
MRIAMLAPFGIRPKGTLSARMLPLAQALVRRSHRVAIIAPPVQNPEDAGTSVTYNGVPVTHIALSPLPGPAHVAQQVVALCGAVRAEQPDIVHLFKPKGYSGLAALLLRAWMPRTPLVVDTDDWEGWGGWNDLLPYPRAAKQLFSWQERNLPRRAAAVTVVSRTLETQVRGFGVPSERIFYLPNGMMNAPEPRAQRFTAAPPTILLYTRFWEFDVRDVVAVLAGIVAGRPDARLLVVGKGERGEEQELLRLAERAGLGAAIDYRGWTEPARLPDVLASADVALVPMDNTLINRARGLAKLLELMALGLPIVASRVGQVDEYLASGECGWLVPPGDPGALARGVLALLGDPGLAFQLGLRAQQRAWDEYSWDRLALVAEHAYQRAHVL